MTKENKTEPRAAAEAELEEGLLHEDEHGDGEGQGFESEETLAPSSDDDEVGDKKDDSVRSLKMVSHPCSRYDFELHMYKQLYR